MGLLPDIVNLEQTSRGTIAVAQPKTFACEDLQSLPDLHKLVHDNQSYVDDQTSSKPSGVPIPNGLIITRDGQDYLDIDSDMFAAVVARKSTNNLRPSIDTLRYTQREKDFRTKCQLHRYPTMKTVEEYGGLHRVLQAGTEREAMMALGTVSQRYTASCDPCRQEERLCCPMPLCDKTECCIYCFGRTKRSSCYFSDIDESVARPGTSDHPDERNILKADPMYSFNSYAHSWPPPDVFLPSKTRKFDPDSADSPQRRRDPSPPDSPVVASRRSARLQKTPQRPRERVDTPSSPVPAALSAHRNATSEADEILPSVEADTSPPSQKNDNVLLSAENVPVEEVSVPSRYNTPTEWPSKVMEAPFDPQMLDQTDVIAINTFDHEISSDLSSRVSQPLSEPRLSVRPRAPEHVRDERRRVLEERRTARELKRKEDTLNATRIQAETRNARVLTEMGPSAASLVLATRVENEMYQKEYAMRKETGSEDTLGRYNMFNYGIRGPILTELHKRLPRPISRKSPEIEQWDESDDETGGR